MRNQVNTGAKHGPTRHLWFCDECNRSLSSKRSFLEHKNTHLNRRPFKCKFCAYAAASQMTLRRHTLRIHVPKEQWRYHCPYCVTVFVEPTGYQSHVEHRHPGFSCTFACRKCPYSTLCSTSFWNHVEKHSQKDHTSDSDGLDGASVSGTMVNGNENLHLYTVDDELGVGWSGDGDVLSCDLTDSVLQSGGTAGSMNKLVGNGLRDGLMRKADHLYYSSEGPSGATTMTTTSMSPETSAVPEVQIQVEVHSGSCEDSGSSSQCRSCSPTPLSRSMELLPDGQIDFDLD